MAATLEAESTLTERYQTTVPMPVRRALRLNKRDKVHYSIRENGEVVISRAVSPDESDPVLGEFLNFLAQDVSKHPERLQAVSTELVNRLHALTINVIADIDAPLSSDDE